MHAMTAANLRSAFGGESMAHMRYKAWAAKAEVHATNHFRAMRDEAGAFLVAAGGGFGLGSTSDNLAGAIEGETFEIDEMYPTYKETAQFQGEKDAVLSCHYALEAEKIHAKMYTDAKAAVDAGSDIELGPVQICTNCGHTADGDAPDKCPICAVGRDQFVEFAA